MPWKLTAIFSSRPYISGTVSMDYANSINLEYVDESGKPCPAPRPGPRRAVVDDDLDGWTPPVRTGANLENTTRQTLTYPHARNQTPSASFPTFKKPDPDGVTTQFEIDDADNEGYTAYLESGVSPAEAMSPYPLSSLLDKAWKNGYARAEHSDARSDDDGV